MDWSPPLPAHWETLPLKRVATFASGENITAESITPEGEYPVYGGNGLRGYTTGFTHSGLYVLIGRQGALCGNINYADGRFWASEHAVVVTPRRSVAVVWLGETLRAMNLGQYSISTAQPGLSVERVIQHPLPVPPLPEQRAIAAFLDRETARIDALIGHKERLIALMEEKRQAVISHAVTRGLDPSARLVTSDTEWLAEKPTHWTVRKVKHFARSEPGAFIDGDWIESPYITDDGIRLIQCGNVGTGVYEEQGYRYISDETFRELNCTEIAPGDVLICRMRSSPRILAGRACVAPDLGVRMLTAVDNCILKPGLGFDSRFLVYQMSTSAYLKYVEAIARGGTRDRISRSMLADIKLVVPPIPEQRAIADHLDQVCSRFIRAADRIRDGIARLQEYRTVLISAAVTGQIDVRGEVTP